MNIEEIEKKIETYYRLKAVLVSPLAAPVVIVPSFFLAPMVQGLGDGMFVETFFGVFMLALLAVAVAFPITALVGFPMFLALKQIRLLGALALTGIGAVLGGAVGFSLGGWVLFSLFSLTGAAVAFTFWFVYTRRSPEHRLEHYK